MITTSIWLTQILHLRWLLRGHGDHVMGTVDAMRMIRAWAAILRQSRRGKFVVCGQVSDVSDVADAAKTAAAVVR